MIIKLKTNTGIIEKEVSEIIKAFRGSVEEMKLSTGHYSFVKAITKLLESKWQARLSYHDQDPWKPLWEEYRKGGRYNVKYK